MATGPTTGTDGRPAAPTGTARRRLAMGALLVLAVGWSITGLEVTVDRLLGAPGDAWDIFRRMFPPAFAEAAERGVVGKVFARVWPASRFSLLDKPDAFDALD